MVSVSPCNCNTICSNLCFSSERSATSFIVLVNRSSNFSMATFIDSEFFPLTSLLMFVLTLSEAKREGGIQLIQYYKCISLSCNTQTKRVMKLYPWPLHSTTNDYFSKQGELLWGTIIYFSFIIGPTYKIKKMNYGLQQNVLKHRWQLQNEFKE